MADTLYLTGKEDSVVALSASSDGLTYSLIVG